MFRIDVSGRGTDKLAVICLCLAVVFMVCLIGVAAGTLSFDLGEIWRALSGASSNPLANRIVHNIRLPRILTALLAGMNLAVAGALLQGVLRNPLTSPHIIGVNAGAGLMAVTVMVLFPGKIEWIPPGAFLGALFAASLVYGLSLVVRKGDTVRIILAGVAVSSLLGALTSGLMFLNNDQLDVTYGWLLGSLSGRGWGYFHLLYPYSLIGIILGISLAPKVNLFSLGDEIGGSLGLRVQFYRVVIMAVASILAGSAVSVVGTIGFVGLMAPHLARLMVGNDCRYSLVLSALLGGILLVLSDTLARTIFQPVELSVGVVTAVLGAPFFILLLFRK
ncbi:iron ABC transporter permease [Dethiosulfovibrio sp. F2B]|uniref:FecCD family ABC transporter permease n=1 Tax=Dethiosulfovibrio faecalis TaxID=2720018 RepID=UPI001F18AEC9|nr:iron ABC transporter permease [Dethiosulfovibrio faecalis]MCF4152185.1 iron ABC transporter permease [Dethiosulfovibrio faecalis]